MAFGNQDNETVNFGGGAGGMGSWGIIIAVVVVLWVLFREDRHRGGHDGGRYDGCGMPGVRPTFYDESNYEEERNLNNKICMEAKETNALIIKESERNTDRYIQSLRDKNTEKDMTIQRLQAEGFTSAMFAQLNGRLDRFECEIPKRQPVFAASVTPCVGELPRGCGFPRRGSCGDFDVV
jgi:hypothetical protein